MTTTPPPSPNPVARLRTWAKNRFWVQLALIPLLWVALFILALKCLRAPSDLLNWLGWFLLLLDLAWFLWGLGQHLGADDGDDVDEHQPPTGGYGYHSDEDDWSPTKQF